VTAIAKFDHLQAHLVVAETPKDCADLAAKAKAIQAYAKHIGLSLVEQNKLARFRIDCMRKAGQLLRGAVRRGGSGGSKAQLEPLGVERLESQRWQRLARIAEQQIEQFQAECGDELEFTYAGLMRFLSSIDKAAKKEAAHEAVEPAEMVEADIGTIVTKCSDGQSQKFACIYADPPWQYGNQGTRAATDNHYPTMPLDDICALPIKDIAADNAHLHLWTTNAFLFDAKRVMESWGFTYKSCFVWVKPQMGIGNYWRVSHEFLLLGLRGDCPFLQHDEMSWGEFPRGRHSAKPDKVRQMIERVSPGPRIELFSRERFEGWSAWGNQVGSNLFTRNQ